MGERAFVIKALSTYHVSPHVGGTREYPVCKRVRDTIRLIQITVFAVIIGAMIAGTASAQVLDESEAKQSLRARQSALFERMLAAPQDLDLMFAYAGVSARLEDYEAAIATLERMLIFNEDLPRVRLELGALYFRIGAYSVSKRYFESVAGQPGLPDAVGQQVTSYLDRIEQRQRRHRFSGRVEIAAIADSNANLGPGDADILLFGLDAQLDDDDVEDGDVGGRARLELVHTYDLGRTNNDVWRSEASYLGRRYVEEDEGNLDSFFIRTGPELSLDAFTFGPKVRPFVDVEYVRADDDSLYRGVGAGVQGRMTPLDSWSFFGQLRGGYRDYVTRDDEDGAVFLGRIGAAWLPGRDTVITATLTGQRDEADADFKRNTEAAGRLSASFAYDPGLSFADDKWVVSAYAGVGYRLFDDPNPVVSATEEREDVEFRLGASHTFALRDGFYASVGATALWRESSLPNYDLENFGVSAAVGYRF
jgi:hypothetical protein